MKIARYILGNKKYERKEKLTKQGIPLAFLIVVAITVVIYLTVEQFFFEEAIADIYGDVDPTGGDTSVSFKHTKSTNEQNLYSGEYTANNSEQDNSGNINNAGKISDDIVQVDRQDTVNINIQKIKDSLQSYISQFKGQYGIYFIDLAEGYEFGINDSDVYTAASTVKIPLNLLLYRKIENGTINPDDMLIYNEDDFEEGTGIIQLEQYGKEYLIKELSRLSIEVSDNIATNMILRLIGGRNLKNYMRASGGTVVVDGENLSCPYDMAVYIKKVYELYKENSSLGKELMTYFENTVFNERIPKLLPENIRVAHKIGNWPLVAYHDVGIVFTPKPYVISIMSKEVDESEAFDVIANISRKVYDFMTQTDTY